MSLTLLDIAGIIIIYQSLVFLFSTLFNKSAKPFFTKILMSIWIIIIFHFSYMLLGSHGILHQEPLGPLFGFIYGPLYYSYTKSLTIDTTHPRKLAMHFIPAFVLLGIIILTSNRLNEIIDIIGLVVSGHFILYLIMSLNLISSYRKQLLNNSSSFYQISLYWLKLIIYLQLAIIAVALLESYFQSFINTNSIILAIFIFTLILIHCFYYLGLKQVQLFKGFREDNTEPGIGQEYSIPEEIFNEYLKKLNNYVENEKPYLEYDITIQDLSESLSISTRNLSHVINKEYKRNYYAFINHYRLEHAKQSLNDSDKSIKEIMYESGFSNKATFYSIFKKSTGLTPSQYRKKQNI